MWGLFSVPDIFADAFLDPDARRNERPAPPFHCLAQSLQVVQEGLNRLLRDRSLDSSPDSLRAVVGLQRAMVESLQLGARLPIGKMDDDDDNADQKLAAKYLDFLNVLVMKVNSIRPGELLMCPGGWRTSEKEGHAVVYLVYRAHSTYTLAVCNTGSGQEYHPAKSELAPPKLKRALTMVFEHIPLTRLADSSFWFMLFRPMVYPEETNGPSYLYEVLFPYLNSRPLSSNAMRQDVDVAQEAWRPPPVAAAPSASFDNPFGNVPVTVVAPEPIDFTPRPSSTTTTSTGGNSFGVDPFLPSAGLEQFAAMAANPTFNSNKPVAVPPATTKPSIMPAMPSLPANKPVGSKPLPTAANIAPPLPPQHQHNQPPQQQPVAKFESFDLSALSTPLPATPVMPPVAAGNVLPQSNPNAGLFAGLETGTRLEFGKKSAATTGAKKTPPTSMLPVPPLPPNKVCLIECFPLTQV